MQKNAASRTPQLSPQSPPLRPFSKTKHKPLPLIAPKERKGAPWASTNICIVSKFSSHLNASSARDTYTEPSQVSCPRLEFQMRSPNLTSIGKRKNITFYSHQVAWGGRTFWQRRFRWIEDSIFELFQTICLFVWTWSSFSFHCLHTSLSFRLRCA
jgi:hypothetical protein